MKKRNQYSAILKIKNASNMTLKRRKEIADWLRKEARELIRDGDLYSKLMTSKVSTVAKEGGNVVV